MKCTKDLRDTKYNEQTLRYINRFSATLKGRLLIAAIFCSVAFTALLIVFFNAGEHNKITCLVFISIIVLLFICAVIIFTYVIFYHRYYFNIAIDEENIFIRKSTRFYIISRFEVGNVLNNIIKKRPTAISGGGNINLTITPYRLILNNCTVSIKIPDPAQLAYILTHIAENPHSGINWGLAYRTKK